MKKSGRILGLVVVVVIGYMILSKMAPDYREVSSIREDNGLELILWTTGEDTYVYQVDEPHAVYVEVTDKKFSFWRWKYRYEVRYVPYVDSEGNHITWDPDEYTSGPSLDGVLYLDDMN